MAWDIVLIPMNQNNVFCPLIFDQFYRVSNDRSRQTGGAGLGLAIAQAQHGHITVQSEIGKGSTFTVRLPLASVEAVGRVDH
jgi:signal transduction histidine kinase